MVIPNVVARHECLLLFSSHPAYFISFGPHGPRKAITKPGQGLRTFTGVTVLLGATVALFYGLRHFGE